MNAQELLGFQEAYLGLYGEVLEEGSLADMFDDTNESYDLDEAKFEKDKSKWEKEEIRNVRAFGSPTNRERATGMRRTFSAASRGVKKELPTGNEPTTLAPKYDSRNETKKQLEVQRSRQRNRQFNADLRREREAKKYANQVNSRFRADSAGNDIKSFRREEVELIISHLLDEGYANTPEAAQVILDNMSEGWKSELVKRAIKAVGRGAKRTAKKAKREAKKSVTNPVKATVKRATKRAGKFALGTLGGALLGLPF